jgi:hypothetical protein
MSDSQVFVPTHALYINGACVCEFYIDDSGYWVDEDEHEGGDQCPYQPHVSVDGTLFGHPTFHGKPIGFVCLCIAIYLMYRLATRK